MFRKYKGCIAIQKVSLSACDWESRGYCLRQDMAWLSETPGFRSGCRMLIRVLTLAELPRLTQVTSWEVKPSLELSCQTYDFVCLTVSVATRLITRKCVGSLACLNFFERRNHVSRQKSYDFHSKVSSFALLKSLTVKLTPCARPSQCAAKSNCLWRGIYILTTHDFVEGSKFSAWHFSRVTHIYEWPTEWDSAS